MLLCLISRSSAVLKETVFLCVAPCLLGMRGSAVVPSSVASLVLRFWLPFWGRRSLSATPPPRSTRSSEAPKQVEDLRCACCG